MALCSIALTLALLLPVDGNALARIDRDVITDDFLSVSCARQDSCLLLDKAGNIWFSSDGGKRLNLRAYLPKIGLLKIRMSGLLDGWGLDSKGSLWKTRDGGKSFDLLRGLSALPRHEKVTAFTLDDFGKPWLGTSSGSVYTLGSGKAFERLVRTNGGPIISLSLGHGGAISTLSRSGWLFHWEKPGSNPVRTKPLGKGSLAVLDTGKDLLVSACSNKIAWSNDRGRTWKKTKTKLPGVCLIPLAYDSKGTIVLGGLPGRLILVGKSGKSIKNFSAGPQRVWLDASKRAGGLLLVGDGGARGSLLSGTKSGWKWKSLGKVREGVSSLGGFSPTGLFASFNNGKTLVSVNSGKSWLNLGKVQATPSKILMLDEKTGYALSGVHEIFFTKDGGETWKSVGKWSDLSLRDLFFINKTRGWAVGGSGALVRTSDGGRSWTLARMPAYDRVLYRVLFVNKKIGYVVGAKRGVFKSLDGGKSWKRLASGRDNLRALFASGTNNVWVGGDAGLLLHTTNGGNSWTARPVPTSEPVRALSFVDSQRGLASAGIGGLWVTVNAGQTWTRLELNTIAGVTQIFCRKNHEQCLVGGQRGLLLYGNPFDSSFQ